MKRLCQGRNEEAQRKGEDGEVKRQSRTSKKWREKAEKKLIGMLFVWRLTWVILPGAQAAASIVLIS